MRGFKQHHLLSDSDLMALAESEELCRTLGLLDDFLEPKMRLLLSEPAVLQARKELVLNALSIAVVPKPFWRLLLFGNSFSPYWLERQLLTPSSEAIFRRFCNQQELELLDKALELDRSLRGRVVRT